MENPMVTVVESTWTVSGTMLVLLQCETYIPKEGDCLMSDVGDSWNITTEVIIDKKLEQHISKKGLNRIHFYKIRAVENEKRPETGLNLRVIN